MEKIDEVSEAIGQLRSDVKDIGEDISRIEKHLRRQNDRIAKCENFNNRVIGYALGVSGVVSIAGVIVNILL